MSVEICLDVYFVPLNSRRTPNPSFTRIIGYDKEGKILSFLKKYVKQAQSQGVYLNQGIPNPTEQEIHRFYETVGESFVVSEALIARHATVWLGQLRQTQRVQLTNAVASVLDTLKQTGANENIIKNAYIKFMCWFRSVFGHVLSALGKEMPPKILFEGQISKYELLVLHLLHQAGCDIVYLHFITEDYYSKLDPKSRFSSAVYGEIRSIPQPHFTIESPPPAPSPEKKKMEPVQKTPPLPPPSQLQTVVNSWCREWKQDILLPLKKRTPGGTAIASVFVLLLGGEEKAEYRNRLFSLKQKLEASPKKLVLQDKKVPNPDAAEAAPFRTVEKKGGKELLIQALAEKLQLNSGRVQTLSAQQAFLHVMRKEPETDLVRLYNSGVKLACWIKRYGDLLFEGYRAEEQPLFLFYGPITEAEIALLWSLAETGVDVLYSNPDCSAVEGFRKHVLPPIWKEEIGPNSFPIEPFPQREERVRVATTAYNASKELDQILYSDTGMFRDRQFTRSVPLTLKTTYDEVKQLWDIESQYRPSFRTENGVVYVPNLFVKICGVEKGNVPQYWDRVREMITEDTYIAAEVPFLKPTAPIISRGQANPFLHNRKLDPMAVKSAPFYRYGYLPEATQDYILEKIQALIDYDMVLGSDLASSILSVLLNLEKELLQLLQNFDFTRKVPKFIVVDVTETLFTQEECILLAFLNQVGFDIAVFTPTGYQNLERNFRADSFESYVMGDFIFDAVVPHLHSRKKSSSGNLLGRLFGNGKE